MHTAIAAFLIALACLGMSRLAGATSIRCGTELVEQGDTKLELEKHCGPPEHVASYPEFSASGVVALDGSRDVTYIREVAETWTYAASNKLTRLVTVKRGRVQSIQTVSRLGTANGSGCRPTIFRDRITVGEIFLRCGAPRDESRWIEEREVEIRGGSLRRELVVHERWVYDPGPGRLLRVFLFKNGKLATVTTGSRS